MTALAPDALDFFEVAPENWIGVGGRLGRQLREISEQTTVIAHGLSLSVGGTAPLNTELITDIKHFLNEHNMPNHKKIPATINNLLALPIWKQSTFNVF